MRFFVTIAIHHQFQIYSTYQLSSKNWKSYQSSFNLARFNLFHLLKSSALFWGITCLFMMRSVDGYFWSPNYVYMHFLGSSFCLMAMYCLISWGFPHLLMLNGCTGTCSTKNSMIMSQLFINIEKFPYWFPYHDQWCSHLRCLLITNGNNCYMFVFHLDKVLFFFPYLLVLDFECIPFVSFGYLPWNPYLFGLNALL